MQGLVEFHTEENGIIAQEDIKICPPCPLDHLFLMQKDFYFTIFSDPLEMEGLMIILMFLQLLVSDLVSSDQHYESCNPTECGAMQIASPFYAAQQPSYCGFPGFEISCIQNVPYLYLSGDTYIIRDISYTDQTLWIVNSAFCHSTFEYTNITNSLHNLTLTNPSLHFTSQPTYIILLQDCSIRALKAMSNSTTILCMSKLSRKRPKSVVGAYERDPDWKKVAGECGSAFSVPYQDSGGAKMEDQIRAGFALSWVTSSKCKLCHRTGGRCLYNRTTVDLQCSCSNGVAISDLCITRKALYTAIGVIGAIILIILVQVLVIIICCIRLCIRTVELAIKSAKIRRQNAHGNRILEEFIRSQEYLAPRRYTYEEIKKMTKSFTEKLGEGGYSVVYKGNLLDGRFVAVKMLKQSKGDGRDFINEVASISRTNHVNVVTLLGFCLDGRKRGLVYEFMPNGSLEKFTRAETRNSQLLSWETLFQIALGIARGLEYLHRGCNTRILHFDIKPHNILLGDNFCPKISDFGLAKYCSQADKSNISMSEARGTIGYIAPEVYCRNFGKVSHKSDVYSFGMMVLEVIGCRENANANVDTDSSEYFPYWIYKQLKRDQELEDHDEITSNEDKRLQRKMILVSLWCIQTIPFTRPSMDRVVQMLEGSVESIEVPPVPTLSSLPRVPSESDPSGSSTITIDSN